MMDEPLFETTLEYPIEDIRRSQRYLLESAISIKKILELSKIEYSLAFGTLLGAEKFKGFVPWDDDFDFLLLDDTYEQAINALKRDLPAHLIVHDEGSDPNYFHAWARVKDLRTKIGIGDKYHEHNKLLKYNCLGIDLYKFTRIKANKFLEYKRTEAIKFFQKKLRLGILSPDEARLEIQSIEKSYLDKNKLNLKDNWSWAFMLKLDCPIPEEDFLPLKKYEFEGNHFLGPKNPNSFLKSAYGSIVGLPDYQERKPRMKWVNFFE